MTSTTIPAASKSYFTVRRFRLAWAVELVTPTDDKLIRTRVSTHAERDDALSAGRTSASRQNRPFKLGCVS
ncbi:MAG: hypothetical protein ACOH2M_26525 [Cypionkella sp.]